MFSVGFRDVVHSVARQFLDLMGAAAANCAEMWFCHVDKLLPGVIVRLDEFACVKPPQKKRCHLLLVTPPKHDC